VVVFRSPGYAVSLVAETTAGCLYSAEACAGAGTNPEDLGALAAKLLFEEISRVFYGRQTVGGRQS
jgi:RNA 3'-terminal phosphate cyclase-like protein